MFCHECKQPAVGVCKSCGLAFCSGHGYDFCKVCAVGIMPVGGPKPQRALTGYLQCENQPRMKTIYLDDDDPGPPSCYYCEGLARTVCEQCHQLYCSEHAGRKHWCDSCTKQAWNGLRMSMGILLFIGVMILVMFLMSQFQRS